MKLISLKNLTKNIEKTHEKIEYIFGIGNNKTS